MKVLMFGWEFPPHISGGLGTACYGLTRGMASVPDLDVLFVVPKAFGDEDHSKLDGLIGANNISVLNKKIRVNKMTEKLDYIEVDSKLVPYVDPEEYWRLSSLTVDDLMSVIASGNSGMLKSVKGIGAKTAQRIIVDLKDKVTGVGDAAAVAEQGSGEAYDEAVAALIMLGFTRAAVQKTVGKLLREQPTLKVEEIIKMALKLL